MGRSRFRHGDGKSVQQAEIGSFVVYMSYADLFSEANPALGGTKRDPCRTLNQY